MNHQFKTMPELLQFLTNQINDLEHGKLSISELDNMANSSRELYERLIVIRHKAFEKEAKKYQPKEIVPNVVEEKLVEVNTVDELLLKEGQSFKLDFAPRPTEVTKNQISLIDSIEEINTLQLKGKTKTKTLHEKLASEVDVSTLGERLERLPIADLKRAIGLNQKFLFINELFNKDQGVFEMSLNTLNSFSSALEADNFINNNLKTRFNWDTSNEHVKEFFELVERRYL